VIEINPLSLTVRAAVPSAGASRWTLFLLDDDGGINEIEVAADDTNTVTKIQTTAPQTLPASSPAWGLDG